MTDAEIFAELRAIRLGLDAINTTLGALSRASHLPGDCDLKQTVADLRAAENKRAGAMKVIIPLVSLGSGVVVAVVTKLIGG